MLVAPCFGATSALTSSEPPKPIAAVASPLTSELAARPSAVAASGPDQMAKAETAISATGPIICLPPPRAVADERIGDETARRHRPQSVAAPSDCA